MNRTIDIVTDPRFMRSNMVFDGVQVKAKKTGKGLVHSTPHISEDDMKKIGIYFDVDHVTKPNPRVLQHCVLFYVMYFFCRRGQENLYEMRLDQFKVVVKPDGSKYVEQDIDEKDKNHGVNMTEMANQAKMYQQPGTNNFYKTWGLDPTQFLRTALTDCNLK